jgi:hypothetical protein
MGATPVFPYPNPNEDRAMAAKKKKKAKKAKKAKK